MSSVKLNHSLSVDCVIFGFDGQNLKVLLVERSGSPISTSRSNLKLPGRMIFENEELDISAYKTLSETTGLSNFFLKQLQIFSDPHRVTQLELEWINNHHNIRTDRVVTVAYYGFVKLDSSIIRTTSSHGAFWSSVDSVKNLAMDHKKILAVALEQLCQQMVSSAVAFELLPKKFTIRELQNLYSAVLGVEIDNRNFRKKMLSSGFLNPTGEKQKGVAHKPAEFYTFNKKAYQKSVRDRSKLNFIASWRF